MRCQLRLSGLATLSILLFACQDSSSNNDNEGTDTSGAIGDGDGDPTGDGDGDGDGDQTGDGDGDQTTGDGDGEQTGDGDGAPGECVITECVGKVYQCGNCLDDDNDGKIDLADPNCWGPCDDNEAGFKGNIPGQGHSPCTSLDCYFDANSGSGNDECYWSHSCDPSEPNPSSCNYNPNANLPGSGGMTCETAQAMQKDTCLEICGPLVPNGCDCFGCCEIKSGGETYTVYLGTEDPAGNGSCSLDVVDDPTKCAPCVQVNGCLNPCDAGECEICIGETVVPDDCDEAGCPDGIQSCNPELNSADCPPAMFCVTGCCYPSPG